jgi:hypothetical protein
MWRHATPGASSASIAIAYQNGTDRLTRDQLTTRRLTRFRETLESLVHPLEIEVPRYMSVLKVGLTPQPAVAPARSGVTATTSESTIKSQFWFDLATALTAQDFGIRTLGQLANVLVALLTPAAVVAFVMGMWRVCADLGWAGAFLIAGGFFSHWQVWIALSIALKMLSSTLIAWGSRTGKFSEEN